ncbi:RNA-binding S4 domain-containing protein [Pedobacter sp. BMA]|uniref:RNA-binding S4 domain-containing protein n=1 Tax=Pedobacter sp. BMA TaxID=1663685 RepID=UPI00064A6B67|nr:S4 domain-containing protein [Pedobacter sp. BMA]KLT67567.1 RNA-binding protein [Pedobacter sp. BMA]
MGEVEKLRIDKYLWAIRFFKTRSLATDACKAGRVKLKGQNIKPSAIVKIGDVYQVSKGIEKKIIEVIDFSYNRTDSPTALTKYKDLTPVEETHAFKSVFHSPGLKRDRGAGRPTKKDRRETDELLDGMFEDEK